MSGALHVYYGPEIQQYYFGPAHPFNQRRVELAVDLMLAAGLFAPAGSSLRPVRQASREEALRFHTRRHLDLLERASEHGRGYLDSGDTPAFPGCLDAALWLVGSTLAALDCAMSGEGHAFSVGGGLHHAYRDRASGFCILSDLGVALRTAREQYGVQRAVYLDLDVHHGDGVFYEFYRDGWLLDVDLHQDGRTLFPGTGFVHETGAPGAEGLKLNVPLQAGASDDSALLAWREAALPAIRSFQPELIVMQCGADAHSGDPLAALEWSVGPYAQIAREVHELSHELCDGRLLLTGGGGYNPANVCVTWAAIGLTVGGVPLPDHLPEEWRARFESEYGAPAPSSLVEPPTVNERVLARTAAAVAQLAARTSLLAR